MSELSAALGVPHGQVLALPLECSPQRVGFKVPVILGGLGTANIKVRGVPYRRMTLFMQ